MHENNFLLFVTPHSYANADFQQKLSVCKYKKGTCQSKAQHQQNDKHFKFQIH